MLYAVQLGEGGYSFVYLVHELPSIHCTAELEHYALKKASLFLTHNSPSPDLEACDSSLLDSRVACESDLQLLLPDSPVHLTGCTHFRAA